MAGTLPMAAGNAARARPAWLSRRRLVWFGVGGAPVLGIVVIGLWLSLGSATAQVAGPGETARALRDRLVVTIAESGEIAAKRSVDIRCLVEGMSSIIWVIDEGTVVKQGDKLIELDSADLQERFRAQDMIYKTAKAVSDRADKTLQISESTRESMMATSGLTVKFSLLDLKKYLGTEMADKLVAAEGRMSFEEIARDPKLGGEGLQEKRKLEADISLANEELSRAASKVEWTRTLKDKGYVTGSELEADELAWRRQQVALDQAKTALDLFLRYGFPKAAEKAYTDWREARREYDRVDLRTNREVESSRSDADAKKEALEIEETRYNKVKDQIDKCVIRAPAPGMVTYDQGQGRFGQDNPIQIGGTVRHQQIILHLPDMTEMNVKVKLHESVVKQAMDGAPAFVTIDAFPKDRLTGKVTKIAIMPDRTNMWLNPGLKAYMTEVTLDQTPGGLKPGMSAQVEILVDTRGDVLQVPISAVHVDKGFQVVYVRTPDGPEVRRAEVGLSNDRAVEIKKGVAEGEEVYLYKPPGAPEIELTAEEVKAQEGGFDENGIAPAGAGPTARPAAVKLGPADKAADRYAEKPADKTTDRPADKTKDKPAVKPADIASDSDTLP